MTKQLLGRIDNVMTVTLNQEVPEVLVGKLVTVKLELYVPKMVADYVCRYNCPGFGVPRWAEVLGVTEDEIKEMYKIHIKIPGTERAL